MKRIHCLPLMWLVVFYALAIALVSSFGRYQEYLQIISDRVQPVMAEAWQDSADYQLPEALEVILIRRLEGELDAVSGNRLSSQIQQCHSHIYRFGAQGEQISAENSRWLPWTMTWLIAAQGAQQTWLDIDCRISWLPWLSLSLGLALLTVAGWHLIGQPLKAEDRVLMALFLQPSAAAGQQDGLLKRSAVKAGVLHFRQTYPNRQVNPAILRALISTNRAIFSSPQQCVVSLLARASQPPELHFDLTGGKVQVTLAGIPLALSVTPALYLLWYAGKRREETDGGWVRNPPSNKPDPVLAQSLLELMYHYGGHGRAIRELEQAGLKAKSLDQNRSKIKEALSAATGEEVAEDCLFESRKPGDNPQTEYRLKISPEKISLSKQDV
ncbi:hypothetical protein Q4491_06500 [Photobacterium sp. 2_MG-2023]|uniref:hypothetical protein n=1 Tax=Photobacterium sp. 2_MG-2023 TaxID=3062663 RepID=UPI0026E437E6|nr:hypothetical protein [Photobacterium sp. 2_MG-2023]MDO6580995.1 hypothetical protein [Photobacterium sp. 2_MG-2023]